VNKSLVEVEEDCLEVRVLPGKLIVLARVCNFYVFSEAKYFNLLIKVLPVQVHEVGCLVLA